MKLRFAPAVAGLCGSLIFAGAAYAQAEPVYGPPIPAELVPVEVPEPEALPVGIPLALGQVVEIAARQHPLIMRAIADRRSSLADLRGAKWQVYPSLSVEGLALGGGSNVGTQNGVAANLILEQPLYTFGRIGGTIDRAEAALESSTYSVVDSQQEIALRTVSAYYDLSLATRRELILKDALAQHQELLRTMERRVEQEVSPGSDLDLAQSRTAQIEQDLASVAGLRSTSFSRLQELIGYAEIELGSVPEFNPNLPTPTEDELVAMTLECSPRLKALQALRAEVDAERRVAKARLFPQLLAQASTNEITGTRAGVAVRVQTGNGLSQFSAVQSVEAQIVSAEFELATNEREIRELMRTDYLTYISGLNRALASERVSRSSELVTESYKRQFITGRRGWLDVMNAVRESMTAKLTEADAEIGTLAAYSRLMLRSCIWRPTPIAMEDN